MTAITPTTEPPVTDAALIDAARRGDDEAFASLYERHVAAARASARMLVESGAASDDLVSEAFTGVLTALRNGVGPEHAFRPYLLACVRNAALDRRRRDRRIVLSADPGGEEAGDGEMPEDPAVGGDERRFVARAYSELPERWQAVLWHTEVEGMNAATVGPMLGLTPNAVSALAYRAREGLRQGYLQAHVGTLGTGSCQNTSEHLGRYVRDGVSASERTRVDEHLEHCERCREVASELRDVDASLRAVLVPAVLGGSAAAYIAELGGHTTAAAVAGGAAAEGAAAETAAVGETAAAAGGTSATAATGTAASTAASTAAGTAAEIAGVGASAGTGAAGAGVAAGGAAAAGLFGIGAAKVGIAAVSLLAVAGSAVAVGVTRGGNDNPPPSTAPATTVVEAGASTTAPESSGSSVPASSDPTTIPSATTSAATTVPAAVPSTTVAVPGGEVTVPGTGVTPPGGAVPTVPIPGTPGGTGPVTVPEPTVPDTLPEVTAPEPTVPDTLPAVTVPDTAPDDTVPDVTVPQVTVTVPRVTVP